MILITVLEKLVTAFNRTKALGYGDGECDSCLMSKQRAKEIGFVKILM